MNVFGAFSFGGLIKTFLPGFVWVIAVSVWLEVFGLNMSYAFSERSEVALPMSIVFSVIFGLLSNTIMFCFLNDPLIRYPHRRDNTRLYALKETIDSLVVADAVARMGLTNQTDIDRFEATADAELLLEHRAGALSFAGFRESYWFWMEFQMNLLLAGSALAAGGGVLMVVERGLDVAVGVQLASLFIAWLFGAMFLVSAARKNYDRHRRKMVSLCVSAFLDGKA